MAEWVFCFVEFNVGMHYEECRDVGTEIKMNNLNDVTGLCRAVKFEMEVSGRLGRGGRLGFL